MRVVIRKINGLAAIVSVFQFLHLGFDAGYPEEKRGRSREIVEGRN